MLFKRPKPHILIVSFVQNPEMTGKSTTLEFWWTDPLKSCELRLFFFFFKALLSSSSLTVRRVCYSHLNRQHYQRCVGKALKHLISWCYWGGLMCCDPTWVWPPLVSFMLLFFTQQALGAEHSLTFQPLGGSHLHSWNVTRLTSTFKYREKDSHLS